MHLVCTICSDLISNAENIYVTNCGHLFHHHCLSHWIERSKTCPQCRNKVTEKCMFRVYPTINSDATLEDSTTLQARLDDAQLQLREQRSSLQEAEGKLKQANDSFVRASEQVKAHEKRLVSKESAIAVLKEQLDYLKVQNNETQRLKELNDELKQNLLTLNGLQKVLNATTAEVEQMLCDYSDARTIATFATALKRALRESEDKKKESRDKLQATSCELAREKQHVVQLRQKLHASAETVAQLKQRVQQLEQDNTRCEERDDASDARAETERDGAHKRDRAAASSPALELGEEPRAKQARAGGAAGSGGGLDVSMGSLVRRIESADSPYLELKQSSLALSALQRRAGAVPATHLKPSEILLLNSATSSTRASCKQPPPRPQYSILQRRHRGEVVRGDPELGYDGLGGHSRADSFPRAGCVPRVTARHKLKRPPPPPRSRTLDDIWSAISDPHSESTRK